MALWWGNEVVGKEEQSSGNGGDVKGSKCAHKFTIQFGFIYLFLGDS